MKLEPLYSTTSRWARICVLGIAVALMVSAGPAASADQDQTEMLAELKQKLELNDEQTSKMGAAMAKYGETLDQTMAKHEGAGEPDPQAMIGDIKKVRGDYRAELQTFLSKQQYEGYLALVDAILNEMMSDVAEIRLLDMQPKLKLSDDQVAQLAPIMGSGTLNLMRVIFENADQRLTKPKKIKLAKSLKRIQVDMQNKIDAVLSDEQKQAYAAYKESMK